MRNSLVTSQTALDGTNIHYAPGLSGIPQITNLSALSAEATHFYDFYEYTPGGDNTILNNNSNGTLFYGSSTTQLIYNLAN